jgi:hypothetical protein
MTDIFNEIVKTLDAKAADILAGVGGVFGFLLVGFFGYIFPIVSKKIKGYFQQKFFLISLKKSMEIKIRMAELKAKFSAHRIYLYQFHNGKVFVGDLNFHKYSVSAIFEIVSPGFSVEINNQQSMPLHMFSEILFDMIDKRKDVLIIGEHAGCDLTFAKCHGLEGIRSTMHADTLITYKVRNKYGSFVGILALWFENEVTKEDFIKFSKENEDVENFLNDIKNKI